MKIELKASYGGREIRWAVVQKLIISIRPGRPACRRLVSHSRKSD
ncbi:MAG: hypothetical protein QM668_19345 [Agriterribacter sp.]